MRQEPSQIRFLPPEDDHLARAIFELTTAVLKLDETLRLNAK